MRIAAAAAQLCQPGESVVINCGSTAFLLGREICGKPVQVITNYLPLANYLIEQDHDSVVIMGGQYNKTPVDYPGASGRRRDAVRRALDVHQRYRPYRRGFV